MKSRRFRKLVGVAIAMLSILIPLAAQAIDYTVSTVAGGGSTGCGVISALGTSINISSPWAVTADKQGNVYYTDTSRHNICKIDSSGMVTRIGGTGTIGLGTDNVQGTSSTVSNPYSIAADAAGNVYVPEYYSSTNAIRKIATNGVITTIFNVNHSATYSGDGGLATAAGGSPPLGIAIAPNGDIYFTNYSDFRIRKIDSAGIITTVVGTGNSGNTGNGSLATSAPITYVPGLAVKSNGDLLLSNYYNCVRKVDASSGIISQFAGTCSTSGHTGDGGQATSATFLSLWGIAVDGADNVYLAERGGQTIRKIDAATGIVTTVVGIHGSSGSGNGTTATATLNSPYSVTFAANGDMYIADYGNNQIRKVAGIGVPFTTTPLSISYNAIVKFNTSTNLQASGGSSGKITFYANGKKIPRCISMTYTGNATCPWKPAFRGIVNVWAVVNVSGTLTKSSSLAINVSNRSNTR